MDSVIYLDTHVVAWLYGTGTERLSTAAIEAIAGADDVRVSPMVRLELQYFFEIARVTKPAAVVIDALQAALGLTVCWAPSTAVVHAATDMDWTRDPSDRLIVAQASLHDAPLVTRDETLHARYDAAVW